MSTETALLTSMSGQHTYNWTSYLLPPVRGTRAVGNRPQGSLICSSAISSGSPLLSRPRRRFPATDDACRSPGWLRPVHEEHAELASLEKAHLQAPVPEPRSNGQFVDGMEVLTDGTESTLRPPVGRTRICASAALSRR